MNTNENKFKSLEADFARFLYEQTTQVPDYLLLCYAQLGLSEHALIDLLKVLSCYDKASRQIRFDRLLQKWQGAEQELRAALAGLVQQGVLDKLQDTTHECYSLDGLYDKLLELWVFQHSVPAASEKEQTVADSRTGRKEDFKKAIKAAYQLFEGELGRPLSPLEMEKLNSWLVADNWQLTMLREAMQRAVMHGAPSLAYIDKILLRWRKEGINTLEQLKAAEDDKPGAKGGGKKPLNKGGGNKQPKGNDPGFANKTDYRKYFGV